VADGGACPVQLGTSPREEGAIRLIVPERPSNQFAWGPVVFSGTERSGTVAVFADLYGNLWDLVQFTR